MILIDRLSKNFGKLIALEEVNLDLQKGKSYALIGPNGSGKTTLIKCILGMVRPSAGIIKFEGNTISNEWKYRESIGYMPQIGHYPENMRIGELVDMMKNIRKEVKHVDEELLEAFKLYKIFDKKMHTLSGGHSPEGKRFTRFFISCPGIDS